MGIAVKELLAMEYFKDFRVVAGRKGLSKEIQGVTILEAPDATRWARGKELILSSGYVIQQEPDCIRRSFEEGNLQETAAMMIKRDRYLDRIPEDMIALFEAYDIPLISMPFSIPWMDLMSQINTAVLNRTIRRFNISTGDTLSGSGVPYKEQKIRRILQAVETEMKFPAFLYDLSEEMSYYSSPHFRQLMASYGVKEQDLWETRLPHTRHTLCDDINMYRTRLINPDEEQEPRVSWITIPIIMNDVTQAYFVVMEAKEFIDYYDEFAIRIAFLVLQGLYEEMMVAQNIGNVGFENFIHLALSNPDCDSEKMVYQANIQGISLRAPYYYAVFQQENAAVSARSKRDQIVEIFQKSKLGKYGRIAFLDENEGAILIEKDKLGDAAELSRDHDAIFVKFAEKVQEKYPKMVFKFGVSQEAGDLSKIQKFIPRCRKVLQMGRVVLPEKTVWDYGMLGPLTWLDAPAEEEDFLLGDYRKLMEDPKNKELLKTLKIYLENNMNYSVTAEKMYVHINTIRNRIDRINDLIDIDWDDPISRLKTELTLQFLDL